FAQLSESFARWLQQSAPKASGGASPALARRLSASPSSIAVSGAEVGTTPDLEPDAGELRVNTLARTFGELPRTDMPWLAGLRIVWVDDRPRNVSVEWDVLEGLGASLHSEVSTDAAVRAL